MDIRYLVVHCSDSPNGRDDSAEDIHRWHLDRGWSGIGYHAVVRLDGTVELGRPPYWQGAHVRKHNHHSLGVCLIGTNEFTTEQFRSLESLLLAWQSVHPDALIVGHRDLDDRGKTCPNFDVHAWWSGRKARHID